jgi:lysophospholipase L1-like esterase
LHLSAQAYERWAEAMTLVLKTLMK